MTATGIARFEDVRPGDLTFTNIDGFFPGVFPVKAGHLLIGERVRLGKLSIDHVAVVTEAPHWYTPQSFQGDEKAQLMPGMMVQAMPGGAEEVPFHYIDYWSEDVAFCRLPEDYVGQALDAAAIARLFVDYNVSYSFGSYGMLAAHHWGIHSTRLEARIDRRQDADLWLPGSKVHRKVGLPIEAICSVLGDQSWTLTGKKVMHGVAPQVVTPGALALQLWRREGVIWGGAGINF